MNRWEFLPGIMPIYPHPKKRKGDDLSVAARSTLLWERILQHYGVHFGSPSTVAGVGGVIPTPIAQVLAVPECVDVAVQPVPPDAVEETLTPDDGTKPFRVVPVAPPTFDAAPVTYTW